MLDYLIVLGQVPGTDHQISFFQYMLGLAAISFAYLVFIERRSLKTFLTQIQLLRLRLNKIKSV